MQQLDQALAWHLKELAKLCPEGTKFTMVARVWRDGRPDDDAVLVIGDEPDGHTKGALFAAVRALNGVASNAGQHHRASGISSQRVAPILVGAEVVQEPPPGGIDVLDLNGGVIDVVGKVGQG